MSITTLLSILFLSAVAFEATCSAPVVSSNVSVGDHESAIETRFEIQIDDLQDPGYQRFAEDVGLTYAYAALQRASEFVLDTFKQSVEDGKGYSSVVLTLESFSNEGTFMPDRIAITRANHIRLNSDYIAHYLGDVRKEYTGIIYHVSARVWQWDGLGRAPVGLISGVADYVRLKAGWSSDKWARRGSGSRWDEGYAVTAYFLDYCESLKDGFVSELNAKMKYYYSVQYFEELLGRSVYDLWNDYKSKYYVKVEYNVIDEATTPGGIKFQHVIGIELSTRILERASEFVLKMFGQDKSYEKVLLIVESFVQNNISPYYHLAVASTVGNVIRLNADYIEYYRGSYLNAEVTGILYHECTHVWQWSGNYKAPKGLVNGIADYVRLKAGWASERWPERGSGVSWDEGYAVTAYFLEYCESLQDGFVAQLNALMKYDYSPFFFRKILGKDVEELWSEYKSKYIPGSQFITKPGGAALAPLAAQKAASPAPAY